MNPDVQSKFWGPARLRRAKIAVLVLATVIVVSQWVRVFDDFAQDDFRLHWSFGERFVAGEYLYRIGHTPYPPFWGMACAPLSLLPKRWAHVTAYPICVVSLGFLIFILDRLSRRSLPAGKERLFWSTAAAVALSSRFVIRELPECGPNLLMVTLAWSSIALWRQGRDGVAGACLGLAIALKCTQALFVPYFVLKRQWRMVTATMIFTLIFSAAPLVRQGPELYERHLKAWASNCWKGLSGSDPSVGVLGQEEVWNVALKPTLARFLMHLPPGHKGRIASSWRGEWLDLSPPLAGAMIKAGMIVLLAHIAWRFRRPAHERHDHTILWEGAVVSLLILLYSPLTWRQHCVAVLPAFYLIARTKAAGGRLPKWMHYALGIYVSLVLVFDRGVVGRNNTLILDSFGATTWSILLLLAVTLGCHARQAAAAARRARQPNFVRLQRQKHVATSYEYNLG
jgi:alpha-1,2-mannosyltransferase